MAGLDGLRRRIDALDDQILGLLNARARIVDQVYAFKRKSAGKGPVHAFVPSREAEILRRLAAGNPGPFPAEGIRPVFREIISACRSLEGLPTVAYAGAKGSPAGRAALDSFGSGARLLACRNTRGVFEKLSKGLVGFGVVPAWPLPGEAGQAFELLAETDFTVCAEVTLAGPRGSSRFAVVGSCLSRPTGRDRTSVLVDLPGRAGSDAAVRTLFKRSRLNLGTLEGLPGRRAGFARYLVEFDGHQSEARVRSLLTGLSRLAARVKVLGSYPAA